MYLYHDSGDRDLLIAESSSYDRRHSTSHASTIIQPSVLPLRAAFWCCGRRSVALGEVAALGGTGQEEHWFMICRIGQGLEQPISIVGTYTGVADTSKRLLIGFCITLQSVIFLSAHGRCSAGDYVVASEPDCAGHRTHCCWRMDCCWRSVDMEGATTHSRLRAAVSEWVSEWVRVCVCVSLCPCVITSYEQNISKTCERNLVRIFGEVARVPMVPVRVFSWILSRIIFQDSLPSADKACIDTLQCISAMYRSKGFRWIVWGGGGGGGARSKDQPVI